MCTYNHKSCASQQSFIMTLFCNKVLDLFIEVHLYMCMVQQVVVDHVHFLPVDS